ncbi:hypothetical protein H6F67_03410 [Microcoleus sp. FACHB-1515]|uniref:hypothetical protein n=1 Tax=Cyanophyceae TaxID=3028117 RepID=UPI001686B6F7|nr:hypothetical protein [Microcoleus sp. FACHB-1515]MBD2088898.1 hypothetical protein [Microcoleus sp. FACHB-1515]
MLIIYTALNYDNIDRTNGEKAERFEWLDITQTVSNSLSMGSDRIWSVIETHSYYDKDFDQVQLVIVHPQNEPVPPKEKWDINTINAKALNIELSPEGDFLGYEWDFIDRPPTIGDRLMTAEPIDHSTQFREVPRDWVVSKVEPYERSSDAPYPLIRLCWCVAYREPIAV